LTGKWFASFAWWMALIYNFTYEYDRKVLASLFYTTNFPYIFVLVLYLMNEDRKNAKDIKKGDYTF
jgi:hypothetical protein